MGYTHCPDVFPLTLGVLGNVFWKLENDDVGLRNLQAVFVSIDPERDNPDLLKPYVTYFHQSFTGVTGDKKEVNRLCHNLGCDYVTEEEAKNPIISHPTSLFVIDPSAYLVGVFPRPSVSDHIIEIIKPLIQDNQLKSTDVRSNHSLDSTITFVWTNKI